MDIPIKADRTQLTRQDSSGGVRDSDAVDFLARRTRCYPFKSYRRGTHRAASSARYADPVCCRLPSGWALPASPMSPGSTTSMSPFSWRSARAPAPCRSRKAKVSMLTPPRSSAFMEAAETFHAEQATPTIARARMRDLDASAEVVDWERLPQLRSRRFTPDREIAWSKATSLGGGRAALGSLRDGAHRLPCAARTVFSACKQRAGVRQSSSARRSARALA